MAGEIQTIAAAIYLRSSWVGGSWIADSATGIQLVGGIRRVADFTSASPLGVRHNCPPGCGPLATHLMKDFAQ